MACSGPNNDNCAQGQYMNYLTGSCMPCNTNNTAANPVGQSAAVNTDAPKKATAQDWAAWITACGAAFTGAAALTAAIKGDNNAIPNNGNDFSTPANNEPTPSGMSNTVKIAIAIGAVVMIGGLVYMFRSRA